MSLKSLSLFLGLAGLIACKPASFKSIEQIEGLPEAAISSDTADALPQTGGAVLDESVPADEITSTETKVNPPVVMPPVEEALQACADAKAKGTLQVRAISVLFPAKNTTCEFAQGDNLSRLDSFVRARREEFVDLPLDGMQRLCGIKLLAGKQPMKFDDEIFLTLNNLVLASSQDYSSKSKNDKGEEVYANKGLSLDNDGIMSYKWLAPFGLRDLPYLNGKLKKYCLGLNPASADFEQLCQIPETDTNGTMSLTLPQEPFLKLSQKAGLVFDKQIQKVPNARLGFVTTGDNDDSDCQHLNFNMTVTLDYIAK